MTSSVQLLPPNATALERAAAEASTRLDDLKTPLREIWDPARCPAEILPWLAYALGVEDWDSEWTEEQKRAVINQSIPIKQHRGTIGAVRDAIGVLGVDARVQEWFNQIPAGSPYTYRLLLDIRQSGFSKSQLAKALQLVDRAKNLRSHVDVITVGVQAGDGVVSGVLHSTGNDVAVQDGTVKYSDGVPALDLLIDAAVNGEPPLLSAIDAFYRCIHVTMPANS